VQMRSCWSDPIPTRWAFCLGAMYCLCAATSAADFPPHAGGPSAASSEPTSANAFYQCVDADGVQVLQNAPCPSDAVSMVPEQPQDISSAAPADTDSPDGSATLPSQAEPGMTTTQVQAILGKPASITQEEGVQGTVVTWTYDDSHELQFDTAGRLVSPSTK